MGDIMTILDFIDTESEKELYEAVYPIVTRKNSSEGERGLSEYVPSTLFLDYKELKSFVSEIPWRLIQYIQSVHSQTPVTTKAYYVDDLKNWVLTLDFQKHQAELTPIKPGLGRNMRSSVVRTSDSELTLLLGLAGRREREEAAATIRGASA